MKQILTSSIAIFLNFVIGCTSNGQDMKQAKINCYANKLNEFKKTSLYKEVMTQFSDTFKVLRSDKLNFGAQEVVSTMIDEAIFFNENKTECLLIVLRKNEYGLVFGNARIVDGKLYGNKWVFELSIDYTFSKDYFNRYPENSFDNIAGLARYNVLTEGEVKKGGCEIDENYWFTELKK